MTQDNKNPEITVGGWWRFDGYEIKDGVIVPKKDAELGWYNPWDSYQAGTIRGSVESPYASLLKLVDSMRMAETSADSLKAKLAQKNEQLILNWCSANGLLGVLLARTVSVTLPARWGQLDGGFRQGTKELYPSFTRYYRTNSGWGGTQSVKLGTDWYYLQDEPEQAGKLVPADLLPTESPTPKVFIQSLQTGEVEEEQLGTTWARFFPSLRVEDENLEHPMPYSGEFWRVYGEPVWDFMRAAVALRNAIEILADFSDSAPDQATEEGDAAIHRAKLTLEALTGAVSPSITIKERGHHEFVWMSKSLLSSLALMAMLDVTRGGEARRCSKCGRLFMSFVRTVKYCSLTCRWASQKRANRKPRTAV
jgi:hypothetical protein